MNLITPYALRGLANCWMPDKHRWSTIYHLDGRENPNESIPAGDVFYTLNVLLGLAKAGVTDYDLRSIYQHNVSLLGAYPMPPYAYGMALWAGAELGETIPESVRAFIRNQKQWAHFTAQDIGMILSGICAQKDKGCTDFDAESPLFYKRIKQYFLTASGLFRNSAVGIRQDFASFAAQTYLITACYHYGKIFDVAEASDIADNATMTMLMKQGANGEWPWFYHAPSGVVVDQYEFYSVHQHGMAALFLFPAAERNILGAKRSIIQGFNWLLGNNDLQHPMLLPELGMIYRSIARSSELDSKIKRGLRSVYHCVIQSSNRHDLPENLTIRKECRSYELGWLLHAFGHRSDLPEITENSAFALHVNQTHRPFLLQSDTSICG
ncbi:MAG: hypothetical protein ACK502_04190 [Alphaproteobacteria bacterium]